MLCTSVVLQLFMVVRFNNAVGLLTDAVGLLTDAVGLLTDAAKDVNEVAIQDQNQVDRQGVEGDSIVHAIRCGRFTVFS